MIGHKATLNKFKKIEIIASIFSDHKGLKLETNLKEKNPKHSNPWKLKSIPLSNEWIKNEIKNKSNSFWKKKRMNSQQPQTNGTQ